MWLYADLLLERNLNGSFAGIVVGSVGPRGMVGLKDLKGFRVQGLGFMDLGFMDLGERV